MLDMLLTADTARKHDHEHSLPHSPSSHASNGSFLVQMPLSIIGAVLRRQTPSPLLAVDTAHAAPDASTPPQKHVMTATSDSPSVTPAPSRPDSSGSSAIADEKPKKRAPRSKTSYVCARPPKSVDCLSTKLHLRPKVLLQLHQIIPSQRPKPTFEIIPFSLLPPRSTRKLARTFNTKERLGPNDLLVVKAEAYDTHDEEHKSDDDRWGSREVVGVICPAKSDKDTTEICMDDGMSRWEVTDMPNGSFEFNTTDEHGLPLKARWVLKPTNSRRTSGMSASSQLSPTFPPGHDDKKYTFSTIRANSRRHPIIATMTRGRVDVMDSYSIPSATSPPTPGSVTQSPALTPGSVDMDSFLPNDHPPIETGDDLRRFILVTAVWVASHSFCSSNSANEPSTPSHETFNPFRTSENRRSFPRLLRSGLERLPRSTSFTDASPSPLATQPTPNASPSHKTRSRRANSLGNAHLHSMSGSMRRRYGLAFEDQALTETDEERQTKRSVELLRIKELALPTTLERIRARKTQSAYNPITTAGLWDSGVTERPGLKSRPTSMFVLNEKKKKQDRKRERSKSKEDKKYERERLKDDRDLVSLRLHDDWHKFKTSLRGLFRREKA
ncbi:hypothetical protein FB567DRAFT_434479 [Paraphoma chrysanthemicola]|uniref:Uncharacterized protein n=1 Tax=Paraphoma chrysanthemicola TaxID=798071 RepID=A0A8K0RFA9_9PLEO|nr:hypothetical protein FB567DRAFT_434479 [Paraphoma chrysanthemicola]